MYLKLQLRVYVAYHAAAVVTYNIKKMIMISPMIGRVFDSMIVASTDEEWL